MILEQVIQLIPKEFNVKQILDLSDLKSDGDFYRSLTPLKENEFEDQTRIVFYHSQPLVYTFDDLPADSLIRLQKMLVYTDIPNFFCLFITDTKNIASQLEYICNRYTVNENPINFICST